jgi:hypothetical protein
MVGGGAFRLLKIAQGRRQTTGQAEAGFAGLPQIVCNRSQRAGLRSASARAIHVGIVPALNSARYGRFGAICWFGNPDHTFGEPTGIGSGGKIIQASDTKSMLGDTLRRCRIVAGDSLELRRRQRICHRQAGEIFCKIPCSGLGPGCGRHPHPKAFRNSRLDVCKALRLAMASGNRNFP